LIKYVVYSPTTGKSEVIKADTNVPCSAEYVRLDDI